MSETSDSDVLKQTVLIKLIEAMPTLAPLFKELDFVIEVDLDGQYLKEGFEPHVHAKIKIGRDTNKATEMKKAEDDIKVRSDLAPKLDRLIDNMLNAGTSIVYPQGTFRVSTSNPTTTATNTFTWQDISSNKSSENSPKE